MGNFINVSDYGHGGWKVVVVAAILILMQILMVTGRFVSRKMQKVSLAADDFILLLSSFLTIGLCALAIACKPLSIFTRAFRWTVNLVTYQVLISAFTVPRIAGVGSHLAGIQMMVPSEGTLIGQVSTILKKLTHPQI